MALVPELVRSAAAAQQQQQAGGFRGSVSCLLRLLCRGQCDPSRYTNLQFQTRGAFGGIYKAKMMVDAPSTAASPGSMGAPACSDLAIGATPVQVRC